MTINSEDYCVISEDCIMVWRTPNAKDRASLSNAFLVMDDCSTLLILETL